MSKFITFQSFYTLDEAENCASILEENNIIVRIETDAPLLDKQIIGEDDDLCVHLKVREEDYSKANAVMDSMAKEVAEEIVEEKDEHYLLKFSDEELINVIRKPDEWSKQDYFLSLKILSDRGVILPEDKVSNYKAERLHELSQPESGVNGWLVMGYLLALFGGILGIPFGYLLMTSRKVIPDGTVVYLFDENTRAHGKIICILGLIVTIISTALIVFAY
jgi:hypothetical protein